MAFLKKGEKKPNHKYVARIGTFPKYRYFYTQAEYKAYLKGNKVKNDAKGLKNDAKKNASIIASKGRDYLASLFNKTKSTVNTALKRSDKVINKLDKVNIDVVNKSSNSITNGLKKLSAALFINKAVIDGESKRGDSSNKKSPERAPVDKNKKQLKSVYANAKDVLNSWVNEVSTMLDQIKKKNPSSFDELKKKDKEMSRDQDQSRVNPYYCEDMAFKINCSYCTAAYDLRRRGYDVEADDYHDGTEPDEKYNDITELYTWFTHKNNKPSIGEKVNSFFKLFSKDPKESEKAYIEYNFPGTKCEYSGPENKPLDNSQVRKMKKDILSQGEGARGVFLVYWCSGDGHAVSYEVINNKVVLRDSQTNRTHDLEEFTDISFAAIYYRTDNEEPTKNILNCVKNKTEDTTNPGVGGPSRTSWSALASEYNDKGYDVRLVASGPGPMYYIVTLSDGRYLIINEDGSVRYKNSE